MQHSFGLGPRSPNPPHGAQQAQGTGLPGAPRPEEQPQQQHHKPFFYIQPSQPYMPMQNMQWPVPMPMPVSYNPYYNYPGLGKSRKTLPLFSSTHGFRAEMLSSNNHCSLCLVHRAV